MPSSNQADLFGESIPVPTLARESAVPPVKPAFQPLAARMRPRALGEIVGQDHLLKPGSLLPRLIATNRFGSFIFYGPAGSGKTSFAEVIARETKARFVRVNAVMSNVAELRDIL